MLELAMLVMGIVVLIRGRMSLSKAKEVRGAIARFVGLIMVAPVPIVIAYAVATGKGAGDGPFGELFVAEIAAVLSCFVLAMILAYSNAELKDDRPRSRRNRFDDELDDHEDGRRRRDDYEDEPRRRRRDDDYDDRDRRDDDRDRRRDR